MHGSDGQEGALWLTTDVEVGIFEISHRAQEGAMFQNPMAGGGRGPQQVLQLRSLAEAQGLPDGRVVRIVSNDADGGAIITLLNLETARCRATRSSHRPDTKRRRCRLFLGSVIEYCASSPTQKAVSHQRRRSSRRATLAV